MENERKREGARRVALTGGIACGKSLVAKMLRELGCETLDADDIVHELIPEEERMALAKVVFHDAAARKALEARIHPQVEARFDEWFAKPNKSGKIRIAVIPLIFEVHWEEKYDIICAVISEEARAVERMMTSRGYSRDEALSRIGAQMPVREKAKRSHYTIHNDGTVEKLANEVAGFVSWLKKKEEGKK